MRFSRLALSGLALVALAASAAAARGPVPMSSSAIMFYDSEFQPWYGQPISQCELLLNRAKEGGSNSVNLVPTQYWIDDASAKYQPNVCHPDNWAENQKVSYYCSRFEWNSNCEPFNAQNIARFEKGIKGCIQKAHDMFDEVLISPHLDDGTKTMHWRNMLFFDPYTKDKYGYSYWDIMLNPILKAVKEVYTKPGKRFIFGPEGEMGGTVFYAPASYQKVVDTIKSEYKGPAKVDTALMFNHAYLPGVINRAEDVYGALPQSKMWKLDGGWGALKPFEQWPEYARLKASQPALIKLLNSVDVLGVSCYARASETPKPSELESCAVKYDAELKAQGFDLKAWAAKPGKQFIYNEFALGGGISECGDTPAKTRAEAGRFPWLGATTTYSWNLNPWKDALISQYNRDWYKAAMDLFRTGGLQYPISGVYLWNVVSWDVQGIHPASSEWGNLNNSYRDTTIMEWIKQYNAKAVKAVRGAAAGAAEPEAAKPDAKKPEAKKPEADAKKPAAEAKKPAAEAKAPKKEAPKDAKKAGGKDQAAQKARKALPSL
ncbi:hypothetical protein Rsub_05069 [Raphidocelis subcapitata]|uniref:Uncharacterized protein n=1 Tax=Raphidocelis subcapitata TaxID=307507 RepID=A0A2V0P4B9_9CHLO|nr:hypothetical protein Rsub_05069 [Raphidocelis subcapitata]|eukprot:GBF92700.1 hypothetical protein Rsub_05069 [Raphidocelis subcapitata]